MAIIVFEHSPHVGVGRLGATLRDYGHKLRFIRPHEGQPLPADLDDVDGVISCGGPQSANDADSWIAEEIKYLRDACDAGLAVIGICLGSQLLAKALGGKIGPINAHDNAGHGIELGWQPVLLDHYGREDILHTGLPWNMDQFHWHREQVKELPAGAKLLATSDKCSVQAWTWGVRVYGFQYHPAVDGETIERWIEHEPDAVEEAGMTPDELRASTERHYPAFERLTQRLFESIALFLMPVDRKNPGVVKGLLH